MDETHRSSPGRTAVSAARERVRDVVDPVDRTETLPVSTAVGRPLADAVTARRAVPHYEQAAVDGFAVGAEDTTGASGDSPRSLDPVAVDPDSADTERVDPGTAVRVDAGDEIPPGADAVVPVDGAVPIDSVETDDGEIAVSAPVESGSNVRAAGSDIEAGETVLAAGHRLRPTDPALCTAVGRTRVEAVQRPTVGILPTGDALVGGDPDPGEVVETSGTTIAEFTESWGGKVTYRDAVGTDPYALRAAVKRDLTKDLLVTTGGTGDGEHDRMVDIVDELGEVVVDGVALDPGGTAAVGVVHERPVLLLPGDPVASLVTAVQLLGPAVTRLAHRAPPQPSTVSARLDADIDSTTDVRTVVPVTFESADDDAGPERVVCPVDGESLSTIARADGWVVVPAERDGPAAGETVSVERWETEI